ncbi:MAG: SprB repeat-containing protein [Bacteroidetes bacterium]|nr:SprB repeat-containing protein [Bacteroidota bacterium]
MLQVRGHSIMTDAHGCSASTTVTITEPTALNASAVASGTILCFGATTNVNVSATGGTAPYSGTGTFNQGAGTISYSVTDANGCTSSSSVTLTQPAKVEGVTSSTAASGCSIADGTASVVVSGGTGSYTYLWSNGQTLSTATALVAGPYSVTFTDANGCTGSATVTVSGSGGSIGTPGAISGAQGACRNTSGIVYSVSAVPERQVIHGLFLQR